MLDSLQEIQSNPITNRFLDITSSYGIHGTYVDWQPGGLNSGGIYFVCGLDPSKILNQNIDIYQIIENRRKSLGDIQTDAQAFKINGEQPLMVHRHIVNYCQQLDALQKIYSYLNQSIPKTMAPETIDLLKMTWRNLTDVTKPIRVRQNYEKVLRNSVATIAKKLDKSSSEYKEKQYLSSGYYDTGKGKFYNWRKMHFAKYKNEVTLQHLLNHAGRINSAIINYSSYKAVRQALDRRPDILYNFSEVKGGVLNVENGEGYGSEEKNDRRFYTLRYPAVYSKDVERIILEVDYPKEFHRNLDEIDPSGYGIEHIVVPDEYFGTFRSLCENHEVQICIDHSAYSTITGGIPVAFSAVNSPKAYAMLKSAIKVFENDRVLRPEQAGMIQAASGNRRAYPEIKEPTLSEKLSLRNQNLKIEGTER